MLKGKFSLQQANQLNPLVLAFVGDAIYEIFIRTYLVNDHRDMSVHKLHVKTIAFVKAHSQSDFMKIIVDKLNEQEMAIFKRGRNSKSGTVPKNADIQDYRNATGFEAVMGFLYLTEQMDRLNFLLEEIIVAKEGSSGK